MFDQIIRRPTPFSRQRNGPSVTTPPFGASVALNSSTGSAVKRDRSSESGAAIMRPLPVCTHSWQNTIHGLPSSTHSVPSRHIHSYGVTEPSFTGVNGPIGLSLRNTHTPRGCGSPGALCPSCSMRFSGRDGSGGNVSVANSQYLPLYLCTSGAQTAVQAFDSGSSITGTFGVQRLRSFDVNTFTPRPPLHGLAS